MRNIDLVYGLPGRHRVWHRFRADIALTRKYLWPAGDYYAQYTRWMQIQALWLPMRRNQARNRLYIVWPDLLELLNDEHSCA